MDEQVIDLLKSEYSNIKRKKLYPIIVQVGVGGTGSNLSQQLAQMMSLFGQHGYYCLADPDHIEKKNISNQLFVESNVGKKKAEILARRYSTAYNINISSYTEKYIEDVTTLVDLFNIDYQNTGGYSSKVKVLPILIGCVDNNYTRRIFHDLFESVPNILYLDSGNESTVVPPDFPNRPKEDWNEEEWDSYSNSGWTGQVVCGLKISGQTILEPVASRYPEILTDNDIIKKPSELSCEELTTSDPQRLLTNRMAAMAICAYLTELFECGTISNSRSVFHAKKGYMKSEPI
ncbi:thiamine biosynthesis protein ThiF [Bacillus sp. UMB0899]|nr:thiamine biosynthesis protein ThiF [Bacillus sp. UMB0899]